MKLSEIKDQLTSRLLIRQEYQIVLGVNYSRRPESENTEYPLANLDEALGELVWIGSESHRLLKAVSGEGQILDYSGPDPKKVYETPPNGEKRLCPHVVVLFDEHERPLARAATWLSTVRDSDSNVKGHSAVGHLEFGLETHDTHHSTLPPTIETLCGEMVLRRNITYGGGRHYAVLFDQKRPVGANLVDEAALKHIVPAIQLPKCYD